MSETEQLDPFFPPHESDAFPPLLAVYEYQKHGCVDKLAFEFAHGLAVVSALPESDELNVSRKDRPVRPLSGWTDVSNRHPWTLQVGKPAAWVWRAVNHQGYYDALMISFGAPIYPTVVLVVAASTIHVAAYAPATP